MHCQTEKRTNLYNSSLSGAISSLERVIAKLKKSLLYVRDETAEEDISYILSRITTHQESLRILIPTDISTEKPNEDEEDNEGEDEIYG